MLRVKWIIKKKTNKVLGLKYFTVYKAYLSVLYQLSIVFIKD